MHGYKDGNINLTLTLPEGLLKSYVSLLDTLHEFFRFLELKSRSAKAEAKVYDPVELERREKFNDDFVKDVLEAYDGFIAQGYPVKRSISLSNSVLKAKKHPWATYDLVFSTLRENGRFKGVKLYQKASGGRGGVVSSETPRRDPPGRDL